MIRILLAASLIAASLYLLADLADHFGDAVDSRHAQIEEVSR